MSERLPGWVRELLFLIGVGYLGACTLQYLEANGAPTMGRWVIVIVAAACIIVGRKGNRRNEDG